MVVLIKESKLTGEKLNQFLSSVRSLNCYGCYTKGLAISKIVMATDGNPVCYVTPNGQEFQFGRVIPNNASEENKKALALLIRRWFPDT